jgi:hypothetical protein
VRTRSKLEEFLELIKELLTFRSAVAVREPASVARELAALRAKVAALYAKARA